MKTIRDQAAKKGVVVAGKLRRLEDDVFEEYGRTVRHRIYADEYNTTYAIDWRGELVYICGDDWCC